jgi:hypothetical protein
MFTHDKVSASPKDSVGNIGSPWLHGVYGDSCPIVGLSQRHRDAKQNDLVEHDQNSRNPRDLISLLSQFDQQIFRFH